MYHLHYFQSAIDAEIFESIIAYNDHGNSINTFHHWIINNHTLYVEVAYHLISLSLVMSAKQASSQRLNLEGLKAPPIFYPPITFFPLCLLNYTFYMSLAISFIEEETS